MAPKNLNADVLSAACQFLTDVSDVLSFSLTCSSLCPIATRRLLAIRSVPLTDSVSLRKFHLFLFANAPARTPYVHTVQIAWGSEDAHQPQPDNDVSLLVKILTSCPKIEDISVFFHGPGHPHIVEAIWTLQNLRRLSVVHGWSQEAPAVLRGIRAPIRVLRLQPEWGYSRWLDPTTLGNILLHLTSTLEELELGRFTVDPPQMPTTWGTQPPSPLSTMVQYPSIRSLTIRCIMERLLLDRLQHVFPALHGKLSIREFTANLSDGSYTVMRVANKLAQDIDVDGDGSSMRTWKKLDRVICNPVVFYILALRCPIHLVMLRRVSAENRRFVTDALSENPVPRLQLEIELDGGLGVLDGLFPPELAGTLTHLTVVFKYANVMRPETNGDPGPHPLAHLQWHDVFDRTVSALQPLDKLTHLRLVVETNVCHFFYFLPVHSNNFIRAVRGSAFDFPATAAALVPSLPSLRYLFVVTDGRLSNYGEWNTAATRSVYEKWRAARGWRVAREEAGSDDDDAQGTPGGEPALVELTDAVVETIVWKEELFTSEAEEESLKRGCL